MGWNGESWLLSAHLSEATILAIASLLSVVLAVSFVVGWIGLAQGTSWARVVLVGAAVLSTVVLIAMWDGQTDLVVEKGVLGVLINVVVVGVVIIR